MTASKKTNSNIFYSFSIWILLLMVSLLSHPLSGQNSIDCTLVGQWAEGPCYSIELKDNYAFSSTGRYLEINDISDPSNPIEVARYLSQGIINDIIVRDQQVFLAINGIGLNVLDISDIYNPIELSFLSLYGYYNRIAFKDNYLYYSCNSSDGLYIIDISDPSNPTLHSTPDVPSIYEMEIFNDYLFAAARVRGFLIYDISAPDTIIELAHIDRDYTHHIEADENYAYISTEDSLFIYDISLPSAPELVSHIATSQSWYTTYSIINNNTLFTVETNRIKLFDATDPENPVYQGEFQGNPQSKFSQLTIKDDLLIGACGPDGLYLVDISDPTLPNELFLLEAVDKSFDIKIKDDYAYSAHGLSGLLIFDISDASSPKLAGSYDTQDLAVKVALSGDYAYLCDRANDLLIINISDPNNPFKVTRLELDSESWDIKIVGELAYIAQRNHGLSIINISDPTNPYEVSSFDTEGQAFAIDVSDNLAYIADYNQGMRIIDISDPSNPFEAGYLSDSEIGKIHSIAIYEDYAIVGQQSSKIFFIDISNPAEPFEVSKKYPGRAQSIMVSDHYAYVSSEYRGLYIYDITDPENPVKEGYFNTGGFVYGAAKVDDYVYLSDFDAGLAIIEIDITNPVHELTQYPKNDILDIKSVAPNPFINATTVLYEIHIPAKLQFALYDIHGKLIQEQTTNHPVPGRFNYFCNGTDIAGNKLMSGIYFLRITTGKHEKTIKLIKE